MPFVLILPSIHGHRLIEVHELVLRGLPLALLLRPLFPGEESEPDADDDDHEEDEEGGDHGQDDLPQGQTGEVDLK